MHLTLEKRNVWCNTGLKEVSVESKYITKTKSLMMYAVNTVYFSKIHFPSIKMKEDVSLLVSISPNITRYIFLIES